MNKGTYPEILSEARFYQHFKHARQASFDDVKEASKWLGEHQQFQIYTEIEGEGKYYMDRGFHYVNRTGYYVCVLDNRYIVMKYEGFPEDKKMNFLNKIIHEDLL